MIETATLVFRDLESSDEACAIVRYSSDRVSLCLSLKANGDIEVSMAKEDAGKLIEALKRAVDRE